MGPTSSSHADEPSDDATESETDICVCRSSPDRLVFIEDRNNDAWIATDTAVDLEP